MSKGKNKQRRETRQEKSEVQFRPAPFQPKTQKQAEYIQDIEDNPYTFATGRAGTGKTYIPCRVAAKSLNSKHSPIDKIVLCRPATSASVSIGLFKGTKEEKMLEWIRPMLGALQEDFPLSYIEYMIKVERIMFIPLETIKGHSFKNSFVIVDEAEDINVKELKAIMTRLGTGSKLVLCGDISQIDIKGQSGLEKAVDMRSRYKNFNKYTGHVHFDEREDMVRNPGVSDIIFDFETEEELENS